ncbi:hypothetical protein MASR1M31_13310 [Porphyromonadaceae bacterium]
MKELKKEIQNRFAAFCKSHGYKKRGYGYFKVIENKVTFSIMIGIHSYNKKYYNVDAMLGLVFSDIDDVFLKLVGYRAQGHWGSPLYNLLPNPTYKMWKFYPSEDNEKEYEDFFFSIEEHGFPYIYYLSDEDRYFKRLVNRERWFLINRDRFLPILYYLRGEKEKGMEVIQEEIQRQLDERPTRNHILNKEEEGKTIVLYAGIDPDVSEKKVRQLLKTLPEDGKVVVVGPQNNGEVDPDYLKFAEAYAQLE